VGFLIMTSINIFAWVGMPTPKLKVEGRYLKDPHGNTVNLHGVAMTPSPWFNGCGSNNCHWNNYDITGCLNYNNSLMDKLTNSSEGWNLNYIRLHIDPYWTNTPGMPVTGENDISAFDFERLKTAIDNVIVPMIKHAKSRGMYVILRPPGVCPGEIAVNDAYNKYLLKVWGYLATCPDLRNADNVMFELANEPVLIMLPDGTYGNNTQGHFDQLKLFFQPIVDLIRSSGANNILWIPGTGYQSQYKGYAINPIKGENIGYAVHIYPGFLNGGPDYSAFKNGWNENVKPVADFAPIAVTEVDWSPEMGTDANGKTYNMGTWGTGTTGTSINPGFGFNFKRIMDESGNVSWNLLAPEGLIDKGDLTGGIAFNNNPEACANACNTWFTEYSKVNFPRPDFVNQSHSDNGNGTYTNPLIFADFPDPDVIRVGDVYYMVTTTMYIFPGATILKSLDLVNWEYCSNPLSKIEATSCYNLDGCNRYSRGQWAPSLKYNNGKFYLLFNTLDEGNYLLTATDPEGTWEKKKLPSSFYDAGLFFDDDGKIYVVHGIDDIKITELDANFIAKSGTEKSVFKYTFRTGLEGSHLYKINGYYYIYATYGGYPAFQVALRSQNIFGPYEEKKVIEDDNIHQGSLIQTQTGEWWSIMFYDKGAYGRLLNLEPITWVDNWPIAGTNGKGVTTFKKPNVGKDYSIKYLPTNDNFRDYKLGMQWGWNHNPDNSKWSLTDHPDYLRLKTVSVVDGFLKAKNTLTQRIFGYQNDLTDTYGTIKMNISNMLEGDIAGLGVFQEPYGSIGVKVSNGVKQFFMDNNGTSLMMGPVLTDTVVYLRAVTNYTTSKANFYYSLDNVNYLKLGSELTMAYSMTMFTGNKFSIFNYPTVQTGGYVDVDWFSTEKDFSEEKYFDNSFVGYSAEAITLESIYVEGGAVNMITGSSKTFNVTAVYLDGHKEDITFGATYDNPNPNIVEIVNGRLIGKENGVVNVNVSFKGKLGDTKTISFKVSSLTFPLINGLFNPSIYSIGTFNETTKTLITGQWGFGGWTYDNGLDISGYKYLVAKISNSNTCGASLRIFDKNDYWSGAFEVNFGTAQIAVINLTTATKLVNNVAVKLNPSHIFIAGIWTNGGIDLILEDVYLTNSDSYAKPTAVENVIKEYDQNEIVDVFNIMGIKILSKMKRSEVINYLPAGLYIVGHQKVLIMKK